MDELSKDELRELISVDEGPCLSIYLPTHKSDKGVTTNPARFKSLIRAAERQLQTAGLRSVEIQKLISPARKLIDSISFWRHQSEGLAVFCSPRKFERFRLPIKFEELAIVSGRFHIKPLIRFFTGEGQFYVLALSQNDVRLLRGSHFNVTELDIETVPTNLADALRDDVIPKQIHFHSGTTGRGGKRDSIIHGASAEPDAKDAMLRYFHRIDKGLHEYLKNERAPLVLAGVDYLFPIYKEVNTYPFIVDEGIEGNPDRLSPEQLHEKAWKIVQPRLERAIDKAVCKYKGFEGTGSGLASSDIHEILDAAFQGRIEYLLVAVGAHLWGSYDPNAGEIRFDEKPENDNEDLLDYAAVHTIWNRGTVYVVERERVPGDRPFAAMFRF